MSADDEVAPDVPSAPARVRLEVAIAEMRGMLNTVVAQHNARLDENSRQLAEQKHQITTLQLDVAQLKIGQAAADAGRARDDQSRAAGMTRGQLIAAWGGLIVLVLSVVASTVVSFIHHG